MNKIVYNLDLLKKILARGLYKDCTITCVSPYEVHLCDKRFKSIFLTTVTMERILSQ